MTESGDSFYGPGNYASNNRVFRRRVRIEHDFSDGTAHTVLFAEKYAACSYWALADGECVPWYVPTPTSGFQDRPRECDPTLPQTPHRGGMNVGMADGSVRTVPTGISPATWYAAQTPDGGEELGEGDFVDW
jgi:prepilin-type processing-associated H-X9-DG protein